MEKVYEQVAEIEAEKARLHGKKAQPQKSKKSTRLVDPLYSDQMK